ncbi:MAG: class I SAM-dependent methyltransferase [Aulosira sp. ZfuVER01]|nr:class I SAM-dependent methyltransferase [Aulosira sp. ZfuVER01]MDZ8001100.1 class I SAM-dependent methyltransferase [Aulosira sp. DedVER01a]MDZ8053196.1 class I SAM-dependent methyltransferase [Aulosira sp. ZfuCHP01]
MEQTGPNFYDDEAVFATYMRHRQRADTANDTLEKPVIMDLIRCITGKRILDLGCGDAAIGRELLHQGAASYTGIEGSHKMATVATKTLADTAGQIVEQTIENWTYPHAAFDLVIARLSLHYVADLAPICTQIFHALAPEGRFVFSVEHPTITSCDQGWTSGTRRQDWVVDNYFKTGVRVTHWLGGTVQKYHRTVEDYFHLLNEAGLIVEDLREARPQREHFQDLQIYERRKRIPLFLMFAARKP